jgi:hypothetical protein
MMPKRTRSLAAISSLEGMLSGSNTIFFAANIAPVVPAVVCRNERRVIRLFFMIFSRAL